MFLEGASIFCLGVSKNGIHPGVKFCCWLPSHQRPAGIIGSENADISVHPSLADADRSLLGRLPLGPPPVRIILDNCQKNLPIRLLNPKKSKSARLTMAIPVVPNSLHLFLSLELHKRVLHLHCG